ncbi:hypothetical protein BH10ACT9_BH10ACT9_59300 [soil metagenome]
MIGRPAGFKGLPVVVDPQATHFGAHVDEAGLVTGAGAVLAPTPVRA